MPTSDTNSMLGSFPRLILVFIMCYRTHRIHWKWLYSRLWFIIMKIQIKIWQGKWLVMGQSRKVLSMKLPLAFSMWSHEWHCSLGNNMWQYAHCVVSREAHPSLGVQSLYWVYTANWPCDWSQSLALLGVKLILHDATINDIARLSRGARSPR